MEVDDLVKKGEAPVQPQLELVLDSRADLGEGPVWDVDNQSLYWVDLFAGVVHCFDTRSSKDRTIDIGEIVGCVVPRANGNLLAATQLGVYDLDPYSGAKVRIADIEAD